MKILVEGVFSKIVKTFQRLPSSSNHPSVVGGAMLGCMLDVTVCPGQIFGEYFD